MPETLTLERDLAVTLGLPRKELAHHRASLSKGVDWGKQGTAVGYTDIGVEKLQALVGVGEVELPQKPLVIAKVTKANIRNPRLIEAEYEGERVLVRIKQQNLYVIGMPVVMRRDGPGWSEGRRPKRKGYVKTDDV